MAVERNTSRWIRPVRVRRLPYTQVKQEASTASSHSRPWADSQESGRRTSAAHSPAVRARKESKNTINVDKKCL